jgi:hypothetical protein
MTLVPNSFLHALAISCIAARVSFD